MLYVDVLVELKAKQIDKTFTYLVPDNLKEGECRELTNEELEKVQER